MHELSKSQKKIARELIQKSLQIECSMFLERMEQFINNRQEEEKSPHESYLELYKKVKEFDKQIMRRYDGMRGSRYYMTIVGLLHDEILTNEDLSLFNEEVQKELLDSLKVWSED